MPTRRRRPRVREPVQVYLDRPDRELLEQVAAKAGLSKAEVLRRGLRRMAEYVLTERPPGSSFEALLGALGDDPSLPEDLAARHDDYLYGAPANDVAHPD
jgi:hypothetical protein